MKEDQNYKKYKDKSLITVGVLGNRSKGKSFILSKISKIKLLAGIHTEGLSVKYPELKGYKGRQIIFIDSVGFENPVLRQFNNEEQNNSKYSEEFEQNRKFKKNAIDNMVTEFFLQNLIINISDILLVVVGELTYSEQLLIQKIKEESKKQNKKRIFIIHNLKEFRTKEQVEDYIKDSLIKCSLFDLKKRIWISTEKDKEKKDEIMMNGNEENEINMNGSQKSDENMNIINLKDEDEININIKDKNIH